MSIVQAALAKLLAPSMAPLADRITALEAAPGMSAADRETLAKAAALVAEFEGLAEGTIAVSPVDNGGAVTVPEIR
jgi:hypothetical protein